MNIFDAVILGIVEGLTEFLPVSSTGHMILAAKLMGLQQTDTLKCFEVVIQLGFIPTAAIGFLLYKSIKSLFAPQTVAYALIGWGVIFIAVELFRKARPRENELEHLDQISYVQAFIIGLSQCFAMVPGTSRSGATIIAGLLCGLSRNLAARFSFLLAIPTMFAATFYDTYKNLDTFAQNSDNITTFLVGGIVAFVVALAAIKLFLSFVSKFDFIPFGIYRILIGVVFFIFVF